MKEENWEFYVKNFKEKTFVIENNHPNATPGMVEEVYVDILFGNDNNDFHQHDDLELSIEDYTQVKFELWFKYDRDDEPTTLVASDGFAVDYPDIMQADIDFVLGLIRDLPRQYGSLSGFIESNNLL